MAARGWQNLEGEPRVERTLGAVAIHGADVVAARVSRGRAGGAVDSEITGRAALRGLSRRPKRPDARLEATPASSLPILDDAKSVSMGGVRCFDCAREASSLAAAKLGARRVHSRGSQFAGD